jgi:hypothetical protein
MKFRLEDVLDALEQRLKALVEGGAVRFLAEPPRSPFPGQEEIARLLLQALRDGLHLDETGTLRVPVEFNLRLSPEARAAFENTPEALDSLAQFVHTNGTQAGLQFPVFPSLTLSADPAFAPGQMTVQAEPFQPHSGSTAILSSAALRSAEASPETYFILEGSRLFPIAQAVINIGRRPDCDLVLDDPRVSRSHAQLRAIRGRHILFDLESTGGTFVNGQRISQSITLFPGDVISLAGVTLIFGQESPSTLDQTQQIA